jgi:hypothetical protein
LQGIPGAVAVLHTHSRSLDFHPHVHLVMPAAALDVDKRLWRSLKPKTKWHDYLFCQKALAIVFRAKLLAAMRKAGMTPPSRLPDEWVANCKCVGTGEKALVYLGRYLYRGVIQEKDIIACANGQVTYRWRNSETKKMQKRTVSGTTFLHLVLQHVLSKGFRRARNYGFLHPNSKKMIALLQLLVFKHSVPTKTQPIQSERPPWLCTCCGGMMVVLKRSILPPVVHRAAKPQREGMVA